MSESPFDLDNWSISEEPPTFSDSADTPLDENPNTATFLDADVTPITAPKSGRKAPKQKELEQLYGTLAVFLYMVDAPLAETVANQSESCAASLYELSKTNPRVRRALDAMLETSAWSAVIAAHLPILVHVATRYVPPVRNAFLSKQEPSQQ